MKYRETFDEKFIVFDDDFLFLAFPRSETLMRRLAEKMFWWRTRFPDASPLRNSSIERDQKINRENVKWALTVKIQNPLIVSPHTACLFKVETKNRPHLAISLRSKRQSIANLGKILATSRNIKYRVRTK
jgi:hypothetical protein